MIVNEWQYNNELYHYGVLGMKWGVWNADTRERYLGDYDVDSDDVYRRREDSGSEVKDDIHERGYTYVYDPDNERDDDFYTQFGNRVVDKEFGESGKIAGYTTAGKAFCEHIFETEDYDEVKYTDTIFRNEQKRNGEEYVMSLLEAPYDSEKTPRENESNYNERLEKYGATVLGIGMGSKRHPWLDEEAKDIGKRDGDTVRNDAARRVADILRDDGYIGMRDFKDIGGNAGIESATILFGKQKMRI